MKILVLGADGFVGRAVVQVLALDHTVYCGVRDKTDTKKRLYNVDLLNQKSIESALTTIKPEVVVNCAGVVENSEKALQNVTFTTNLLQALVAVGQTQTKVIVSGSAAEYGVVRRQDLPVAETVALNANTLYGNSKKKETSFALNYAKKHSLKVIIARIFNPIGPTMPGRLLIPSLLRQIRAIQTSKADHIEVSSASVKRDYIDIRDVAAAVKVLVENDSKETVYNIGAGKSTSTKKLVTLLCKCSQLTHQPNILETSEVQEPLVAIQASTARLSSEFGWSTQYTLEDSIKEIVDHATEP